MQTAAVRWSLEVAGRRARRALDGAAPAAVFAAVEQPTVIGLPRAPFELAGGSRPKVGPDIEVGKTLYSVPWRLIGQRVDARATPTTVQVFHDGQLVKTHIAKPRGKQTDMTDYPPRRSPSTCAPRPGVASRPPRSGPPVFAWSASCSRSTPCSGCAPRRECSGWPRHSPARLEAACALAVSVGDPSYRTIKGILVAGTEHQPAARASGDGGAPAHLHGPKQLFVDVVALNPTPTTSLASMTTASTASSPTPGRSR